MTVLTFVPWTRAGISASLTRAAVAAGKNRPVLTTALSATATGHDGKTIASLPLSMAVEMLGPGDVIGIPASQVIRTDPTDGATNVETETLVAVEFDEPTLPWLFTPEVEEKPHQLRPWLCLIVLREQEGVTLSDSGRRLTIREPAQSAEELPDLSEAWAWAHVQYAGELPHAAAAAADAITRSPTASISRLLCPRKLVPSTRYLACVVPTYTAGRNAGLGGTPDPHAAMAPAWNTAAKASSIELPVYHSFSFATGEAGDFASLAEALIDRARERGEPQAPVGVRTLDLSPAGVWKTSGDVASPATVAMPGLLTGADVDLTPPTGLADGLRRELTPTAGTRQLRPPLYGAVQAGVSARDLASASVTLPTWLLELNLDPRLRVAAGYGAQIVAAERENLLAAAWDQVEQTKQVNELLDRAQLARQIAQRQAAQHLDGADALSLMQLTSPHRSRVLVHTDASAATPWQLIQDAADTQLPALTSATYRRLARPRGRHARYTPPTAGPPLSLPATAAQLTAALMPERAVADRVLHERLSTGAQTAAVGADRPSPRPDPLRGIAAEVSFPTGMVAALARQFPDAVLPGAGSIPPNTALSLKVNAPAVGAFMIGLNTEIARVLLWHGVPSDRRATPFRRFWDGRSRGSGDDIQPVSGWDKGAKLEDLVAGGDRFVFALRSDLIRRYPTMAVYAVRAKIENGVHALEDEGVARNVAQPVVSSRLPPDLRVFGFNFSATEAIGAALGAADSIEKPGWFVVLQEQASETRFQWDEEKVEIGFHGSYWTLAALKLGNLTDSGAIANAMRFPPVRVALHARALLPSD